MPEMWKLFVPCGESILTVVPGRLDGRDRVRCLVSKRNVQGKEGLQ
jgi:hypothetical protein